jgi:hypothetical protein
MSDKTDVVLTCPECLEMFHAQYSPYMRDKTVTCPSCSAKIPINENTDNAPQNQQSGSFAASPNDATWLDRNGVIYAGWLCFVVASILALLSLGTATAFVPLFTCTLVFGITAVIQKRFWHGMLLVFAATILSTIVFAVALELQFGKDIREYQKNMKQLEQMFKSPPR